MEGFLQWWTGDPWLIFISLVGGGVGVALILRWRAWPVQRRLLALAVIVLVLHVWEEWRFPGGLHYAYNYLAGSTDAYALARYPMSELTDMLTNVGGVLAGTAALIWAGRSTVTAITVWVVCVVEVLLHLGLGIAAFGVFGTVLGALLMGFTGPEAASIGIIGGADGPTAIYTCSKLAPDLLGAIALSAYSYMAMVPLIQPPINGAAGKTCSSRDLSLGQALPIKHPPDFG